MRIIGFVEGAMASKGGVGLFGVPGILGGTAARGHQVALVVGGPPTLGRDEFVVSDMRRAMERRQGEGTFGMVAFPSWEAWALAPAILWKARRYVRQADFVSLHSLYSFPVLAGYLLARLYRKPYGLWPHGVLAAFQQGVSVRKKRVYDRLIARHIIRHASLLFFGGRRERDESQTAYVFAAEDAGRVRARSVVVPDGFDPSSYDRLPARSEFRRKYLGGHTGPLVLFLARLNAKKGLRLLCDAMSIVLRTRPDARLVIAGPPDPAAFESQVRQWVRAFGIESQTVVTGRLTTADKLAALSAADIYVLPSQTENFGFSVFEAMACRVPVVVSNTLDYAGEIAAARAGFALERQPARFAEAILDLLRDPGLRRGMGANGARLAQRFSVEETARKLERTIDCLLLKQPLPAEVLPG